MNMFRDLAMLACIGIGLALNFADPIDWKILASTPVEVPEAVAFLQSAEPFSSLIFFALALALFMTRIKY